MDREGCAGAMVLPLDICSPTSQLHEAAVEADNAFEGAGVDYLIHNAGMLTVRSSLLFMISTSLDLCLSAIHNGAMFLGLLTTQHGRRCM